jgi:hypothetical protein
LFDVGIALSVVALRYSLLLAWWLFRRRWSRRSVKQLLQVIHDMAICELTQHASCIPVHFAMGPPTVQELFAGRLFKA